MQYAAASFRQFGHASVTAHLRSYAAPAALMLLAALLAFTGLSQPPLEGHEIYVVQTVQEMHDRGDWVLPYFNGEPRLNKPPLNYWLTGLAAWAASSPFEVQPWHARVPSALAAAALVWCTLALGTTLGNRRLGMFAGLVAATSYGTVIYAHNARPEMTYAAACTLALLAFFKSWQRHAASPERSNPWRYVAWTAFALAILAKGPHLPALLALGLAVGWRWARLPWREFAQVAVPGRGLAVTTLIAAPWWVLVHFRLAGIQGASLFDSQLAGTLYAFDWLAALYPKYLLVTPQLLLPWVLLVPALALLPRRLTPRRKLLLALVAVPAVVLNLAEKRHAYYMLPALAPLVVLLCDLLLEALDDPASRLRWLLRWMVPVHAGVAILALVVIFGVNSERVSLFTPLNLAAVALLFIAGAAAIPARGPRPGAPDRSLLAIVGLFALALLTVLANGLHVSQDHYEEARLAQVAGAHLTEETPLVVYDFSATLPVLYSHRSPVWCGSLDHVRAVFADTGASSILCLTSTKGLAGLARAFTFDVLARTSLPGDDADYLVRVAGPVATRDWARRKTQKESS